MESMSVSWPTGSATFVPGAFVAGSILVRTRPESLLESYLEASTNQTASPSLAISGAPSGPHEMETVACSANVTASNLIMLQSVPVVAGSGPGSQTEPAAK